MTKTVFRVLGVVTSLVVGGSAVAQSSAGAVAVWGYGVYGQTDVPINLGPCIDIAAGYHSAVAIKSDGIVVGWGDYRTYGLPTDLGPCIKVACGETITTAIKQNGTVAVWGYDQWSSDRFIVPSDLGSCTQICVGGMASEGRIGAIQADGTVRIWGAGFGECMSVPVSLGACSRIAMNSDFMNKFNIALTRGGVVNAWGQYQASNPADISPLDVPLDLGSCSEIAVGRDFVLALKTDGVVRAWGNSGGIQVPSNLFPCSQIAACGGAGAMALQLDGTVRTWGSVYADVPANLGACVRIAGASYYSMAITGDTETDHDHDGVDDVNDNCPLTFNPSQSDCDHDGLGDACELDCNRNGLADVCEIANGTVTDVNQNGIPDACDVVSGLLNDYNHNGIADSAELIAVTAQLQIVTSQLNAVTAQIECGDLNNDGLADSTDLGLLLLRYGACQADSLTTPQEPFILQSVETPTPLLLNKK